jgi:2-polyprenyl-3-methyl-5-hydroxy-6-metoxy-1,4-benzoquinol methylase
MGLRTWLGFYTWKKFTGSWHDRIAGLFDCGIDFTGKSVLDVGCNMGIVAYEISKRGPSFIHGLDNYRGALRVAKAVFTAVPVESRFDLIDLRDERQLQSVLLPSYDIVLLMEVYHQVRKKNPVAAARAVEIIVPRSVQTVLVRSLPDQKEEVCKLIEGHGFASVPLDESVAKRGFIRFERSG